MHLRNCFDLQLNICYVKDEYISWHEIYVYMREYIHIKYICIVYTYIMCKQTSLSVYT